MLAIAPTEHDWSGQRVSIAPPQFGRLVDIHLSHTRVAEGRRHDHHTVAGAASLAGSAGASPVDLPKIGLDGTTRTPTRPLRRRWLSPLELRRDGVPERIRTPVCSSATMSRFRRSRRLPRQLDTKARVELAYGVLQT